MLPGSFLPLCRLAPLQVAMNQTAGGTTAVSGLRFLCGDPTCQGIVNVPAPPPPAAVAPPAATGDWSPWLGRSTLQSTIGICPCPGYILVRAAAVWPPLTLRPAVQCTQAGRFNSMPCAHPAGGGPSSHALLLASLPSAELLSVV